MAQAAVGTASFSPKSSAAGDVSYFLLLCLFPMASFIPGSCSNPPDGVLSGLLHAVQSMRNEQLSFQNSVNVRLRQIEDCVSARQAGEGPSQEPRGSRSRSSSRQQDGLKWDCPICGTELSHRESFKGHMRLRVTEQIQRCRLMEDNIEHQALLNRFTDGDWNARDKAFTSEFYEQVVACTTSLDPVIKSHEHIFDWLKAAASTDPLVKLPSYSGVGAQPKRRRTQSVDRALSTAATTVGRHSSAAAVGGRSSHDSSPDNVPSSVFGAKVQSHQ